MRCFSAASYTPVVVTTRLAVAAPIVVAADAAGRAAFPLPTAPAHLALRGADGIDVLLDLRPAL